MASYSSTNVDIPYSQNTASTGNDFTMPGLQVFLATLDPNAEINSALKYREWTGRASGAYLFPGDVQVSANFESRSGTPYARTVSFTGGQQIHVASGPGGADRHSQDADHQPPPHARREVVPRHARDTRSPCGSTSTT